VCCCYICAQEKNVRLFKLASSMAKVVDKKQRTVANPCLTVADLVAVFSKWLQQSLSKDIFALLRPPNEKGFSWKTSPDHEWLAEVAPLFVALAEIVPNTVLTSRKMMLAFEALRKDSKIINTSKMSDEVFNEWCDQTVRILFSKYRELKQDSKSLARVWKRCTPKQQDAISQVLSKIKVNDEVKEEKLKNGITLSPPKSWASWHSCSMGLEAGDANSTSQSSKTSKSDISENDALKADLDPMPACSSIFKRILAGTPKLDEGNSSMQEEKAAVKLSEGFIADAIASTPVKRNIGLGKWKMAEHTPPSGSSPQPPSLDIELDESDKGLIKQAMQQAASSIGLKQPGKKQKAKAKAKAQAKAQAKAKEKAKAKATKSKAKVLKHIQSKTDVVDTKTLFKKHVSAAYHKAFKDAIKQGLEAGDAKDMARIAYRKAAEDFEKSNEGL
jgi:hypothetical protein